MEVFESHEERIVSEISFYRKSYIEIDRYKVIDDKNKLTMGHHEYPVSGQNIHWAIQDIMSDLRGSNEIKVNDGKYSIKAGYCFYTIMNWFKMLNDDTLFNVSKSTSDKIYEFKNKYCLKYITFDYDMLSKHYKNYLKNGRNEEGKYI